jgi:hypothetical protein
MNGSFVRLANVKSGKMKPEVKPIRGKRPISKTAKPQRLAVPAALER